MREISIETALYLNRESRLGGQKEIYLAEATWPKTAGDDGSFESFKNALSNAAKDSFGGKDKYVYIVSTFKAKLVLSIEDHNGNGATIYYEIPYKATKSGFEFGTPVRVTKVTSFQKAEALRLKKGICLDEVTIKKMRKLADVENDLDRKKSLYESRGLFEIREIHQAGQILILEEEQIDEKKAVVPISPRGRDNGPVRHEWRT